MPFPLLAAPAAPAIGAAAVAAGEAIVAGATALWALVAANAVPIAVVTTATAAAVVVDNALDEQAAPATGTTTVVGNKTLNCGENGSYEDMLKKSSGNTLDRDHVPSKAALKQAAEEILRVTGLGDKLTPTQYNALFGKGSNPGAIANKGQTIAIPKKDHQAHSDTYAGRNQPAKIQTDSEDLQKAAEKDTKKIEEGEGKEMDDECFDKYKKAAEKIRKKTHAEYIKELTELIKDTMKNVK